LATSDPRGNSTFYFPIVTCIVLSIVLSILAALFEPELEEPELHSWPERQNRDGDQVRQWIRRWP
jgi:hypothetical protein